ncbi:hypothetical protein IPF37_06005 [bacterium]|nr:MAG: hypothetical protein IPF37_06005 [bacterium]
MKRNIFLLSTIACFFLLLPNLQPLKETHKELLNTVEDVLKKKNDELVDNDGVMYALVNIIDSNNSKNDGNGKLICELLDKQVSILEKIEKQTNKGKNRWRIKVKPFEVLKLLVIVVVIVGVIYCVWAYKWYQPFLDFAKKIIELIIQAANLVKELLKWLWDSLPAWGNASANATNDAAKKSEKESKQDVSDSAQEKAATAKQNKKEDEQDFSEGTQEKKTMPDMPQRPEDFQGVFFHENEATLFDKNGSVFFHEKLVEEVKKQNETLKLLLGLNEVPHVFQEDIKLTLWQQKTRFDLEDYIAYAKYLQREIVRLQD